MRPGVFWIARYAQALCLLAGPFIGGALLPEAAHAATLAAANASVPISPEYAALVAKLKADAPDFKIDRIRQSPVAGILEVISGRHMLYVDATGSYVLSGHIFDMKTKSDLTAARLTELARIDPKELPLDDSFAEVRGNGKRQIYVFSDPDCPFCKKLETELPGLENVTIHVFLYPLVSIHPHAYAHAVAVWCTSDRTQAWHNKMLKDIVPSPGSCANPVERNLALGEKLDITGTPTLIFQDGTVLAGVAPAKEIEAMLSPQK